MRELTPRDYLAMLRRRWLLIVCLTVVGCGSALVAAHSLPKRFISQTTVLVEQPTVPPEIARTLVTDDINQQLSTMQQQILSRSRLEPVIRQYNLYSKDADKASMEELVYRLRKTITVTPLEPMAQSRTRNLPGFNVSVASNDPGLAQQICATITSMFMEENLRLRQGNVDENVEFVKKQLANSKAELDDQDAKLAAFKRRYLGSLPDEEQTNLNLLMGLNTQLEAATQALSRAQQDKSFAESILAAQLNAWQASQVGQNPETFEQQLAALQGQLSTLRAKYTDDHPDVIKAKNDVATLKRQIAASEEQKKASTPEKPVTAASEPAQIQQLRTQLHQYEQVIKERSVQQEDIQKQIKVYQARIQMSPAVEQEYKQLTRDHESALEIYNQNLKKLDLAATARDLNQSQQGGQFRVLDAANLPGAPSFPDPTLFGLGGFAGGAGLGLALAFLLEMQDTSLRSERDVEVALRLPVLAKLPMIVPEPAKTRTQTSILGSGVAKTGVKA
jgi:polysaccharide chain length determinant protein (PEP-CTERM system associated)